MRALGVQQLGGPENFRVLDVPEPHAGPGEVRIRVHGATVNPTDTGMIAGRYPGTADKPGPYVPGADAAGVVSEVGEGAPFAVGDEVMAVVVPTGPHGGAYADEVVVPAAQVVPVPAGVDLHAASTLLMNGLTALLALEAMAVPAGGTLAVTGAAGAYGGYVVQLAAADGIRVVADASEADEELVRGLGAHDVVRRGDDVGDRVRALVPGGVDALTDGAVQDALVVPAVRDGGRITTVRGWAGPAERGITVHPVWVFRSAGRTELLDRLRRAVEAGAVTLRVAQVLPAEQARQAHELLAAGGVRGRIVLDFSA
jgi:NADPH2:quinone reductase